MRRRRSSELPAVFKKPPQNIKEMLEYLNLPQSLETYQSQLESAARENISHEEFLKRFLY